MSIHPGFDADTLKRLDQVIQWHISHGARFINLPWTTQILDSISTKPEGQGEDIATEHGILVASGEQSFTKLAREGLLNGFHRFIGWTPCFRSEPVFNETHHYYFLKAELFSWIDSDSPRQQAIDLARVAIQALDQWAGVDLVINDEEMELVAAGMEVGSAGVRQVPGDGRSYAYCTALAEPRFGLALERVRRRE